jgi:hypothetical protein
MNRWLHGTGSGIAKLFSPGPAYSLAARFARVTLLAEAGLRHSCQ